MATTKYLWMVILLMAMTSCARTDDRDDRHLDTIREWQSREAVCRLIDVPDTEYTTDLSMKLRMLLARSRWLEYRPESGDHWKTSWETQRDGGGDCEDLAIYCYRVIIESGITEQWDIDVRLRRLGMPDGSRHVIVIIYSDDETYEISNLNLSLGESDYPVLAEFDHRTIF